MVADPINWDPMIRLRCEIDLSPGMECVPESRADFLEVAVALKDGWVTCAILRINLFKNKLCS